MADNPFQGMLNPNMSRGANLWDLKMMSAANRMELPFERMAQRGMYGHQGVGGNPMLAQLMGAGREPDYSQFTYDPVMRQQAIAAGVQPLAPEDVKQNAVFPNTGFFGNHPRLSAALEGGMFGALAAHGGANVGDSIQGALEGVIGGQRLRQGMLREQFARPFEAAGHLEQLRDMEANRLYREALVPHLKEEADIQRLRVQEQQARTDAAIEAKRFGPPPVLGASGAWMPTEGTPPTVIPNIGMHGFPYIEPGTKPHYAFVPEGGRRSQAQDLTGATREQLLAAGVDPDKATASEISKANKAAQAQKIEEVKAGAGARDEANLPYKNFEAARTDKNKAIDELRRQQIKNTSGPERAAARSALNQQWYTDPNNKGKTPPTDKDLDALVVSKNATIQKQIDDTEAAFQQQWGEQARQKPDGRKGSSQRTGSVPEDFSPVPSHQPALPPVQQGIRDYTQLK